MSLVELLVVKLLSYSGLGGGSFSFLRSRSWLLLLFWLLGLLLRLLLRDRRRCRSRSRRRRRRFLRCFLLVSGGFSLVNRHCMVRSLFLWVGNRLMSRCSLLLYTKWLKVEVAMGHITMEGLMIKFVVLAMTAVDDRIVVGLAVVDFSWSLVVQLFRVDVPSVHRGTLFRNIVGGRGDDGRCLNNNFGMDLMIGVEVARAIVVSEGVLLAV